MIWREKSNYVIQTVSNALDVLDQFYAGVDEIGVTELSKRLKLHKNNVFRLLATLEARGYIEQNKSTENYRLGSKCLQLGQTYLHQIGFLQQARSTLKELVKGTKESAFVTLRRGMEIVPLDFVEPENPVRVVSFLGVALPMHCTAPGKVHLAFESEEELKERLPESFSRYTDKTIVDRSQLLAQIKDISEEGFAVDRGEFIDEVCCVAVPIQDYARSLVGSLAVTGPAYRLTPERVEKGVLPCLQENGKDLSRRLGFQGK